MKKESPNNLPSSIDLGCGQIRKPGFLRVDYDLTVSPDLHLDFMFSPWSLPSDHFIDIYSCHCIEHLPDYRPFLDEVIRIAKHKAHFRFELPHFSYNWFSPDHRRAYGLTFLSIHKQFKLEKIRLEWTSNSASTKSLIHQFFHCFITWIANHNPYICERVWCYWVGGFQNMILEGHIDKEYK